ncbi:hypothetical protein MesoLjLb_71380 [Mesorhizobium sp. L-8-3]|nr:hypothetical protein MesoLjLb_71380 [Mesorhizobium sp. L-8-3]
MDVIETAIRNAFGKGDASDRAFREKVYRSVFAALDRALKANPNITVEAAINRRKSLQAKIAEIESEFIAAVPTVAPDVGSAERVLDRLEIGAGSPRGAAPVPEVNLGRQEPAADAPRRAPAPAIEPVRAATARKAAPAGSGRVEPRLDAAGDAPGRATDTIAEAEVPAQTERVVDAERRRPYAAIFFIVTLLSLGAIGAWWGFQTGLFKTPEEIDTSVPKPPAVTGSEDFDPDEEPIGAPAKPGQTDTQRSWITVFTPSDPSLVNAPGDTRAEVMEDDTGDFIRIRSGASGSAITFDVGQGVLEQLAGRRAVFDIVARAEEGKETQISVDCNFGELGDCGRKRYAVGYEKGEFLFEIELPDKSPGAEGTIAINSDIANGGKAIDVYEIKASVAQ